MIRPLRTSHRVAFTVLALALPVLFAAGLLSREPVPTGAAAEGPAYDDTQVVWRGGGGGALDLAVVSDTAMSSGFALVAVYDYWGPSVADPLAYWRPESVAPGEGLLLGPLVPGRAVVFPLPPAAVTEAGSFVVHGTAEGMPRAMAPVPAAESAGRAE